MGAKHDYELTADKYTHLHLDHAHMGVGGDDSWSPSCHKVSKARGATSLLLPETLADVFVSLPECMQPCPFLKYTASCRNILWSQESTNSQCFCPQSCLLRSFHPLKQHLVSGSGMFSEDALWHPQTPVMT